MSRVWCPNGWVEQNPQPHGTSAAGGSTPYPMQTQLPRAQGGAGPHPWEAGLGQRKLSESRATLFPQPVTGTWLALWDLEWKGSP